MRRPLFMAFFVFFYYRLSTVTEWVVHQPQSARRGGWLSGVYPRPFNLLTPGGADDFPAFALVRLTYLRPVGRMTFRRSVRQGVRNSVSRQYIEQSAARMPPKPLSPWMANKRRLRIILYPTYGIRRISTPQLCFAESHLPRRAGRVERRAGEWSGGRRKHLPRRAGRGMGTGGLCNMHKKIY